jgi:hypothetical protein
VVLMAGCGGTPLSLHKSGAAKRAPSPAPSPAHTASDFSCTPTHQAELMVQGDPDVSSVPAIKVVDLVPSLGGLIVQFKFRRPFKLAPEGVYIAWTIYLYRTRADAGDPKTALTLQIEDRGAGWEPTGWAMLVSTYTNSSPVDGDVHTDATLDELTTFFPSGFVNLSPPFYWYASQEEYRAYLPSANKAHPQDWSIYGSVATDCPAGVRANINSMPQGAKLLTLPA